MGIGYVANSGTEMCTQQGVHQVAYRITSETFGAAVTHPIDFASGLRHGVEIGADQAASVFHAGDMASGSAMATMTNSILLDSSSATSMRMVSGHTGILG